MGMEIKISREAWDECCAVLAKNFGYFILKSSLNEWQSNMIKNGFDPHTIENICDPLKEKVDKSIESVKTKYGDAVWDAIASSYEQVYNIIPISAKVFKDYYLLFEGFAISDSDWDYNKKVIILNLLKALSHDIHYSSRYKLVRLKYNSEIEYFIKEQKGDIEYGMDT